MKAPKRIPKMLRKKRPRTRSTKEPKRTTQMSHSLRLGKQPPTPPAQSRCIECGCPIHPSEKLCGECACEDDIGY